MSVICTLGSNIVFQVNARVVQTITEIIHLGRGRWAVHDVMNGKPRPQFLGPGQNELTLNIRLARNLGANPQEMHNRIKTFIERGNHAPLILGPRPLGNGSWYIEENESTFSHIDRTGAVDFIEINVTLREYF